MLISQHLDNRDSKRVPYHWKFELTFKEILDIQSVCTEAMKLWGYKTYGRERDLEESSLTDSTLKFNWKHSKPII